MAIKAIVICCMDYRFQKGVRELILDNELNYGDYDMVSIKGGAGNFAQLEEHLIVAKTLHNPQKIILTVHEDCGAKATEHDLQKAIIISKSIFGDEIPIVTKYLKL